MDYMDYIPAGAIRSVFDFRGRFARIKNDVKFA